MTDAKVVLITGCASGFGFESALLFARRGFQTVATVHSLQSDGVQRLRNITKQEHLLLEIVELDVTSDDSVTRGVATTLEKFGRIDILVNNAGFGFLGAIEDFTIDEVKTQYETNIFGVLRMVKAVVPSMREKKSGRIINISSINGLIAFPLYSIYSSSKFAIETLSEGLRFELHPFGITVAMIEPGSFLSNFGKNGRHPAKNGTSDSPYKQLTDHFFTTYRGTHDIQHPLAMKLFGPPRVAKRIYQVATARHPRLHNIIGIDAHLLLFLKIILPESVVSWMLRKAYQWE